MATLVIVMADPAAEAPSAVAAPLAEVRASLFWNGPSVMAPSRRVPAVALVCVMPRMTADAPDVPPVTVCPTTNAVVRAS